MRGSQHLRPTLMECILPMNITSSTHGIRDSILKASSGRKRTQAPKIAGVLFVSAHGNTRLTLRLTWLLQSGSAPAFSKAYTQRTECLHPA